MSHSLIAPCGLVRKRSIRYRLGEYGPSVYAEFCLGEPVPLREVVDAVVLRLEDQQSAEKFPDARELVYATLPGTVIRVRSKSNGRQN